ncbi:DNA-directed DNA polymerase [Malassezia psittaci]|uniref:DNA polymerase n=1 Tax=Malassezia psittaci TaxID=1821823 RepID=A0AAF0JD39_9BASI|nr:DNA-directed DNA polymerase [Malassezia psittaci]
MERSVDGFAMRSERIAKRTLSHAIRIYILPQLLSTEDLLSIRKRAQDLGAIVCGARENSNLLLTGIHARRRIEAHTSQAERQSKPIVRIEWLDACEREGIGVPIENYRAYTNDIDSSLLEGRVRKEDSKDDHPKRIKLDHHGHDQPDRVVPGDETFYNEAKVTELIGSSSSRESSVESVPKESHSQSLSETKSPLTSDADTRPLQVSDGLMPKQEGSRLSQWNNNLDGDIADEPNDSLAVKNAPKWQNVESALYRPTPLRSKHNQPLVDELRLLRQHRRLTNDRYSEMAYMRAAAAVKALPFTLDNVDYDTLCTLKGIGPKMAHNILQFYKDGSIAEANVIRNDPKMKTLLQFTEVYRIGVRTAEHAYQNGCRTLEDLTRYQSTSLSTQLGVKDSLLLLPDLQQRIPRSEAETIADEVRIALADQIMRVLHTFIPNAKGCLAGSYRRGAPTLGDIDLIVTHDPSNDTLSIMGALLHLVGLLREAGTTTHTVSIPRHTSNWDTSNSVHVAQIVYRSTSESLHRRVDIVYTPKAQFGAALLGWTGSVLYERDLRRHAQAHGYIFSASGLTRAEDHSLIATPTEASM